MDDPQTLALLDNLRHLWPEGILAAAACLIFLGGTRLANRHVWNGVALTSLFAALIALLISTKLAPVDGAIAMAVQFGTPFQFDALANFARLLALGAGILLVLMSWAEVGDRQAADRLRRLRLLAQHRRHQAVR